MSVTDTAGGQDSAAARSSWIAPLWRALLAGSLILAGAIALADFIRDYEARSLEVATAAANEAVRSEVEDRMRDQLGALERLAVNWERRGGMSHVEFDAEAGELVQDFSFLLAVEWVDPSFHVRWVVPLAGNEKAEGLALAFEARRRTALEASRDQHRTTISRPIQLVQGGLGFIVIVPLEVDGRFDGLVLGVYRAGFVLSGLLRNVAPGFGVRITDDGEILYAHEVSDAMWSRANVMSLRQSPRAWLIEVAPRPEMVATYQTKLPLLAVVSGAVIALGFGFTVHLAHSRRLRNRQLAVEVERREDAEQQLARILKALPDHVWSGEMTPEGIKLFYYSTAVEQITGHSVATFLESIEAWNEIVHPDDVEMLRRVQLEMGRGQSDGYELEYRIRRADGTIGWVLDRVQVESAEYGRRVDGVVSDLTEMKRTEADRLRSQKEMLLLLERERITREMHDGLGGQLVSTIAMLERGRSTQSEVAEALRRALDDMRIMIDSLDPATTDLPTSLGKLRARLEPLLRRNGIRLEWQIENGLDLDVFPSEQSLHILRIIQEAVTNAILHAEASEVSVGIRLADTADDILSIEIYDDGRGFRPEAHPRGRGIGHMKSRAENLGGELQFDGEASGTRIELRIPIPR